MLRIAFDVDGTLIGLQQDQPRYDIIAMFKTLQKAGHKMFIWSGGGVYYAENWAFKLGLDAEAIRKGGKPMDMCFDDEDVNLAKVNVVV